MPYLLIDVGNSYTKYISYTTTTTKINNIETNQFIDNINSLDIEGLIEKVVLVSVIDDNLTRDLVDKLKLKFKCNIEQVSTTKNIFGVSCGYKDHTLLGADRWVAIVAGYHYMKSQHVGKPIIIIDCGTVITVDVVDAAGQHLGGWMAPSSGTMQQVLVNRSSGIKHGVVKVDIKHNEDSVIFGRTTQECMDFGGKLSEVGFIEQCVMQTEKIVNDKPLCIITGGGTHDIMSNLTLKVVPIPSLIFDGLALFIE